MLFELNKNDLMELVKTQSPSYDEAKEYIDNDFGKMWGGWDETWVWNTDKLEKLNNQELWKLYKKLEYRG